MTDKINRQASFNSVIDDAIESRLKELHTCTPGIIQAFNPETKRAEIQPAIKRILVNGELVSMPKLINCPLGLMQAGGFAVTLPVTPGDECMIHFTERSLDAWLQFGDIRQPKDIRLHHESDAYFLPVHTSVNNSISDYDQENVVIRNLDNTQKITLFSNGDVTIDTPADATINTEGRTVINAADEVTVNTDGDANINAAGSCNINGSTINNNGSAAGVVTTMSINPMTGTPFPDGSATLRNSDG